MEPPEGSSIIFRRAPRDVRSRAITKFARTLASEVAKGRPFDCLITGDAELRRLNHRFRGIDRPTDVLSFPALPAQGGRASARAGLQPRLGDLAISLARARIQARAFGHTTEDEIGILMLHGVLHLLGMDHESDGNRMARAEKRWRARLGLPAGLIERTRS